MFKFSNFIVSLSKVGLVNLVVKGALVFTFLDCLEAERGEGFLLNMMVKYHSLYVFPSGGPIIGMETDGRERRFARFLEDIILEIKSVGAIKEDMGNIFISRT